jgi:hypothetical protein
MRLEELKSFSEDELAMLWYAVNKTTPPVLAGVELDPSVFCSIKQHAIQSRVDQIELAVKDEHKLIYDSLRQKLNMAPIEVPKPDETTSDAPTMIPTQISGSESI